MGSRRTRVALVGGIGVGVLIAAASLASGSMSPAVALGGSIPPAVVVGFLLYLTLPAFSRRR